MKDIRRMKFSKVQCMLLGATTKKDVQEELRVTEREARDLIAEISRVAPVISLSSSKGYILLPDKKNLSEGQIKGYTEMCKHCVAENTKRANEILKRNGPLTEWLNSSKE